MMKSYNENSSEINEKAFDLEREVTRIIHQIGVPTYIKGYQYLRMAIMLVVEDCDIIDSATKRLYPSVARKYGTTTSRVEGAIRKAIDIAWDRGDVDILNSYFGYTIANNRGKPTPTEFIAMIADHLTVKESDDPMLTTVTKILHQCGVPADIKGYKYLRTAILLTVKDSDIINSATKMLYPSVTKKYQTTTGRVEGAIRHAIEIAWDRGDVDIINSYFGYTISNNRGRPTSTEFIAMIADRLIVKELDDPMVTNVTKILHQCGVPADIKGYQYLRMAIMLVVEDCDRVKHIYPDVAEKYQTTTSRVEGAIRKAIEISWYRGDADTLNSYFGYTIDINRGKPTPTPTEFIAMIADDLRLKYGKFN